MLRINVGQSRKVSQDFNSQGFSLNLDAELPGNLIEDPQALAQAANNLFQLAGDLLDEQVRRATGQEPQETNTPSRNGGNGNGQRYNGSGGTRTSDTRPANPIQRPIAARPNNGQGNGQGNGNGRRGITAAQAKAIGSMARRAKADADQLAHDEFGVNGINDLSIKQASDMIDYLKGQLQPAGGGR